MRGKKYVIDSENIRVLLRNSLSSFPREACGLLLGKGISGVIMLSVHTTQNDENTPVSFRIRDKIIKEIHELCSLTHWQVYGCFHSHILGSARPSKYDRAGPKVVGDLWLIYSVRYCDLRLFEWDGRTFQKVGYQILK